VFSNSRVNVFGIGGYRRLVRARARVCVCVGVCVCVCVCVWLIFSFLSTLMDILTDHTIYESDAHNFEIYFAWCVIITVPISRTQCIKTFACGYFHAVVTDGVGSLLLWRNYI